jgi:hypothetical protein
VSYDPAQVRTPPLPQQDSSANPGTVPAMQDVISFHRLHTSRSRRAASERVFLAVVLFFSVVMVLAGLESRGGAGETFERTRDRYRAGATEVVTTLEDAATGLGDAVSRTIERYRSRTS